jgi:hypothetical protein
MQIISIEKVSFEADPKVFMKYLDDDDMFIRVGAVFVLSFSKSITIRNVSRFIPKKKFMSTLEKYAWSAFIDLKITQSESQGKNKVVFSLLSSGMYANFINSLLRKNFQVEDKTLYDRQVELGLPPIT